MSSPPEVVGLGYCVQDILAIVPRMPDWDDVRFSHLADLVVDGGGQVGTALTTLARLGVRTGYIGLLGEDEAGRWLRERFLAEGVDVARLRHRRDVGTNLCLLLVDQATARRSILCHQRVRPADLTLDAADRAYIQSARVLHLDGQFLPAAIQAARWARQAGVRVCYDGNHPRPGLEELLPLVDWLVVAAGFPAAYTHQADADEAARDLLALGPQVVVVTQGEHGCDVWCAAEGFHSPGFAVAAVDTTGAGDAFHGAFIYGMLRAGPGGWDLAQVALYANAVAAINCRTLGGRRGLPRPEEVDEFLRQG